MKGYRIEEYVRMEDTDAAGIVHYQSYFRFFGLAETEMFRSLGLDYDGLLREHALSLPRVHVECDFLQPLRLDQLVSVEVTIAAVRRSSLTLEFAMRLAESNELKATARYVIVAVSAENFRAVPLPNSLLAVLEPYRVFES